MSQFGECFFDTSSLYEVAVSYACSSSFPRLQITTLNKVWEESLTTSEQRLFFFHAIMKSIDAYETRDYTLFDAHTTTNCCHGIAVFAREQVINLSYLDVEALKKQCLVKMNELQFDLNFIFDMQWIPQCLFNLTALYTLAVTRKFIGKRMQTDANNLKDIYPVSSKFCRALTNKLRKMLSNIIAHRYKDLLDGICPSTNLHEIPAQVWGRYVQPNYIRSDKRNVYYAPCIYSNQISLMHLAASEAKVALVNDIIGSDGQITGRFVCLLQGDGKNKLAPIDQSLDTLNPHEPIIVFGGYVYSNTLTIEELSQKLAPWLQEFQKLMLACDLFYPQFPAVKDDPSFNSCPISPEEQELQDLFAKHSQVQGVSALDPTLYCASHIYPSSAEQILKTMQEGDLNVLPFNFHGIHPSIDL